MIDNERTLEFILISGVLHEPLPAAWLQIALLDHFTPALDLAALDSATGKKRQVNIETPLLQCSYKWRGIKGLIEGVGVMCDHFIRSFNVSASTEILFQPLDSHK